MLHQLLLFRANSTSLVKQAVEYLVAELELRCLVLVVGFLLKRHCFIAAEGCYLAVKAVPDHYLAVKNRSLAHYVLSNDLAKLRTV